MLTDTVRRSSAWFYAMEIRGRKVLTALFPWCTAIAVMAGVQFLLHCFAYYYH